MSSEALLLTRPTQATAAFMSEHTSPAWMKFEALNHLVAAAMPLLLLMLKLKQSRHVHEQRVYDLRQQAVNEVLMFSERANALHCSPRQILAARYCLCTAIDEAVLATEWGNASIWSSQTLLSIVHKETWGGERFFIILEEMSRSPQENLPLLELIYLVLSLGFEGRYYDQEQAIRDEIKHKLFQLIMKYREEPDNTLSPSLKVLQAPHTVFTRTISRWKIVAVTLTLFLTAAVVFNVATAWSAKDAVQEFAGINTQLQQKMIMPPPQEIIAPVVKAPVHHGRKTHRKNKNG